MTEQATETVATASKEGRIGSITLARKGNNSIADDLGRDLVAALQELEADADVRVIVIRSAYEKYFSVGADLTALGAADRSDRGAMEKALRDTVGYIQECFTRLEKSPKIIIAAINGHALGGGCELALSCDYRIMVDQGRGHVGQPVPAEKFDSAVQAKAEQLAAGAPVAQKLIKQAVNEGIGKEKIEDALEVEMKGFVESALTDDAVIGIMSFLSKQQPEFTGK